MKLQRIKPFGLAATALLAAATAAPAHAGDEESAATPVVAEGDFPGDFDTALALFHEGDGGKDGIGMTKLWPRVSIPALSDAQLRKTLIGNTFRTEDKFSKEGDSIAFYMDPSGTVDAWFTEWDRQEDLKRCPRKELAGDDFKMKDGACHRRRFVDVTGRWEIRNHQLCPTLTWQGGHTAPCWSFVMLLNRLALFDPAGNMLGYEKTLEKGRALYREAR